MARLSGRRIAILVTDGFEEVEMTEPRKALHEAGAETFIVSDKDAKVKAWDRTDWSDATYDVDEHLGDVRSSRFHALLLPGGVMNPDHLRTNPDAQIFVRAFFQEHKPVAAICHAPWLLIDAGVAEGRQLTSYHSLKSDLVNAGAEWVDQEVVEDRGLVTSRNPDDIPAFTARMLDVFGAEQVEGQAP